MFRAWWLFAVLISCLAIACAEEVETREGCQPGEESICPCPEGRYGTMVCGSENNFGDCVCDIGDMGDVNFDMSAADVAEDVEQNDLDATPADNGPDAADEDSPSDITNDVRDGNQEGVVDWQDDDGDGVSNADDACPGFDDNLDDDDDGAPDDCDLCAEANDSDDDDDDGVPDACDICPIGDDNLDTDEDGTPDACDCDEAGDACHANAYCVPIDGGFNCVCLDGYEGDGTTTCTNINECELDPVPCGPNTDCTDNAGGHTCECQTRFYGLPYSVEGCEACDVSCADDCTGPGPTGCTACAATYWDMVDGDGVNCTLCSSCLAGQYEPESATPCGGESNTVCADCDASCATCVGEGISMICTACATGHFNAGGFDCQACEDFCDVCTNATTCTDCAATYYLHESNCVNPCPGGFYDNGEVCTGCDGSCATCDAAGSTGCTECASGYWDADLEPGTFNCTACEDAFCVTCSDTATCITCGDGYGASGGDCHNPCPAGSYNNEGKCSDCHDSCATCASSGSTGCTACASGYWDADSEPGSFNCTPCADASCVTCTDTETCTVCGDGYFASEGNCVDVCPAGNYGFEGVCYACDDSCDTCTTSGPFGCTACSAGYWDADFGEGFECIACDDAYCVTCTDTYSCSVCGDGYGAWENNCHNPCPGGTYNNGAGVCTGCDVSCDTCTTSGPTGCTDCADGYWDADPELDTFNCTACEDAHCVTCLDTPTCTECAEGYFVQDGDCVDTCLPLHYVSDGVCEDCHETCLTGCYGPSGTQCSGARLIYVDQTATTGDQNGTSWEHAYLTIDAGVAAATYDGSTVYVADGLYTGTENMPTIDTDITVQAANRWGATIDCHEGFQRVFNVITTNGPVVIDGFRIQNCQWSAGGPAVYTDVDDTTISNCYFFNNTVTSGNGGAVAFGSSVTDGTVSNSVFIGNTSNVNGGAVETRSGVTIISSLFYDNSASNGGGAIHVPNNTDPPVEIVNSTIVNNQTTSTTGWGGGGIYVSNSAGAVNIRNSIVWGNTSASTTKYGHGISNNLGTVTVDYSCYQADANDIYNIGTFTPTNSITTDPAFVDDETSIDPDVDFHLQNGSGAINTGSDTYVTADMTLDLDGEPRRQNTVDMGVYEGLCSVSSACWEEEVCHNGVCVPPGFSFINPGTFCMGSPDGSTSCLGTTDSLEVPRDPDETLHQVTLTRGFWLQQTEVTQAQWSTVATAWNTANPTGIQFTTQPAYGPYYSAGPVTRVSWFDVLFFLNAMSDQKGYSQCYTLTECMGTVGGCGVDVMWCDGDFTCTDVSLVADCDGYRLPTEAEWEYAARATTTSPFYNGAIAYTEPGCGEDNGLGSIAWYCFNSSSAAQHGTDRAANLWDLYDMTGNVAELCWDRYDSGYYAMSPSTDPLGPTTVTDDVVVRGCSFLGFPLNCRSASRDTRAEDRRDYEMGFRPARTQTYD